MTAEVPYKKGDLVVIVPCDPCDPHTGSEARIRFTRLLTEAERAERAAPMYHTVGIAVVRNVTHGSLRAGTVLQVIRPRACCPNNWGSPYPGYSMLLDTTTGHEIYVERCYLEPVE